MREIYGELLIPLLQDLPFIKKFELELGGRYSNYDRSGSIGTFKILGDWQVTDWLRIAAASRRPTARRTSTNSSHRSRAISAPRRTSV